MEKFKAIISTPYVLVLFILTGLVIIYYTEKERLKNEPKMLIRTDIYNKNSKESSLMIIGVLGGLMIIISIVMLCIR